MPLVARIGDTVRTSGETTVTWSIRDFFSLSDKVDDFYNSPVFSFADSRWYLELYPNGETEDSSAGSLGLYLMRDDDSDQPKTIEYTVWFKCSDGVEGRSKFKHEYTKAKEGYGSNNCYSRTMLQNQALRLMPDNVLTITCHLNFDRNASKVSLSKRVLKVSNNMKTILEDGKRADFTLKLGDREWPVHKVILESRCEYFENMFRHDWIENTVGLVTFADIEEDALDSVLHFIYTGVVEDMSVKNVFKICVAAYKFLLEDLKELCIEYIKETICVETVCRVLVIANVYDSKDLNESAIEYFIRETSKILNSEEWKELKKNHPSVVIELFEETTKRDIQKRTQ